jgi:O-antigen/teichoic acid export membrane protein
MSDARLRRDVAWNLIPVVLLGVVGLGLNFLIGGWWGAAALGVFNQVTTAFFVVSVLGAGGLQYSVLRAVAACTIEGTDDRDRVAAVVVGAIIPTVVLGAVATGGFVLVAPAVGDLLDSAEVARGMLWAAPGLFCFALNKVLLGVVNGLRRMRAFAIYTSLRYTLIAIGVIGARVLDATPEQLPAIWSFTEIGLLLVLAVELFATVALRRCTGWTRWVREHVSYGVRGVGATLAFELNSKLDVWILGVVYTDAQIGVYSLASVLAEGVMQLGVAVQNNINPVLARSLAAGEDIYPLVRRTRTWFVPALAGICLVSAVCYPYVIPFIIGDASFADGAPAYAILVAGIAISAPWLAFSQVLLMASRPGWHTLFVLLVVGLNFAGNVLLIPVLGMEGAATATAVTLVLSMILLVRIARSRAGVRL